MLKIEEKMGGRGFIWALHRDRDATETGRHAVTLNQASICLEVWLVGSIKSMKSIKQAQILFATPHPIIVFFVTNSRSHSKISLPPNVILFIVVNYAGSKEVIK